MQHILSCDIRVYIPAQQVISVIEMAAPKKQPKMQKKM